MALTVAFAGGGSIGHLAPLVAVWRALKKERPDAEAVFLCSDRTADTGYLCEEGAPHTVLPALRRTALLPLAWIRAYRTAYATLKEKRPSVLLSKGGDVAVPACLAARRLGIPIVVHESDATPGRATRFLGKRAARMISGFPGLNPVRPAVTEGSRERGLAITGFSGSRPILLVLGGSQGALALNQAVARHIDELLRVCDVAHVTGPGKTGAKSRKGYWSTPIAYDDLPHIYAIADIALSRAGAGTIAELAACCIPTVLVPLRGVARDHQLSNAEALRENDACVLLHQEAIDGLLVPTVSQLLGDTVKTKKMAERLHSLHTPSASGQIAKVMLSCVAAPTPAA